jgi:hypothetical protein
MWKEASEAKFAERGTERLRQYAQNRVDCFLSKMSDSNPILIEISKQLLWKAATSKMGWPRETTPGMNRWKTNKEAAGERKSGHVRLMDCSYRTAALVMKAYDEICS